jgi:uncharacterized protein YdeI (YjbR/CyaY-like superfamily)
MAAKKAPVVPLVTVQPRSAAEWRRWLAKHHASASVALVVYAKKGSGERSLTWEESVEEALCFGWVDGVRGAVDETHFSVRFTPRKASSIWSKRNVDTVERLKEAERMHAAGLAAFEHGKRQGAHTRAYAIGDAVETPAELAAALAKNARGRKAFEALSPGQQKGWARSVAWAKTAETRAARARDALLLILAGRKSGETDNMAARRGIASKAEILGARRK